MFITSTDDPHKTNLSGFFSSDLSKNAKAAADIVDNFKPEQYQAVLNALYIIAGIMLLIGAGLILYYVKILYDEKKAKEEEEKLLLTRNIEGGRDNQNIPLGTSFE